MNLGRYRLVTQLGASWDGVQYRAVVPPGDSPVEVRLLSGARVNPVRWQPLVRQLRLAAQLDHPGAQRVLELGLTNDPAFVALEWVEGRSLAEDVGGQLPLPPVTALTLPHHVAEVLVAAHRLGLAHGKLGPSTIRRTAAGGVKIDFTGAETRVSPSPPAFPGVEASCRTPQTAAGDDRSADVYALAALLVWTLTGKPIANKPADWNRALDHLEVIPKIVSQTLRDLIAGMLAADPEDRPGAPEACERLGRIRDAVAAPPALGATIEMPLGTATSPMIGLSAVDGQVRKQVGRFRILEKLGEGGMGEVYRAEDTADGSIVAIKVLRPDWARNPASLRRFNKEARLLAEVNNPYVTNLLEVNEDQGVHFLVLEFVAGNSVGKLLAAQKKLTEPVALDVLADVARALSEAHARGIVHRDVKPDNILIAAGKMPEGSTVQMHLRVKLSDFGLARHVDQTDSLNVTTAGAIIGTPHYMSPEQCNNSKVDARSDVYAMGATLFHLLAGRPPFVGETPLSVILSHTSDAPPPLRSLNPALSEGVCEVVAKALAKSPEQRYPHAAAMLADLERLRHGEPTTIAVHPRLPPHDPRKVLEYDFTWDLEAAPAELWPHVSNTERLNRAIGLLPAQFSSEPAAAGGSRRFAKVSKFGLTMSWEEHPFEWIEARRMGVLRQFQQGPFKWYVSVVELTPRRNGGTTLTHRIRIDPRGLLGRLACAIEVGIKARRALERVYRRIDASLTGKFGSTAWVDAFEETAALQGARRRRLDDLVGKIVERGVTPAVAEGLCDFLARAPAQEVARIRPLALARRLALPPDAVVAACLHGAHEGLFQLLWDILCPVCRIPSQVQATLRDLKAHSRCEACNLDFELDFANSVEVIFRAHPEIRDSELGVFCIGGPAHSPHVAVQTRVGAGERIELALALGEGTYRLRGPQLPYALDFRVEPNAPFARGELVLSSGVEAPLPRRLRSGSQVLALTNDFKEEVVVRVERTAPREDALTAARATALALFRELFPAEVLAPGRLVSIATVTLLVTELDGAAGLYDELGDARAFGLVHEHLRLLEECVRREGGAVVKAVGEGVLAAFGDSASAVRAALALPQEASDSGTRRRLRIRAGIHRGPAMAATLNDHLDYFGTTASTALRLPGLVCGGELAMSAAVAADPQVAVLLEAHRLQGQVLDATLPGKEKLVVQRIPLG